MQEIPLAGRGGMAGRRTQPALQGGAMINLCAIRRYHGMSIQEFARVLKIRPETLEDLESGRSSLGGLEKLIRERLTRAGLLPLPDDKTFEIENGPRQRAEFKEAI
jgi:transcriptional regulator with XRE-family HTH domain